MFESLYSMSNQLDFSLFAALQASMATAQEKHERALQSHADELEQAKACVARDIQQVWQQKMRLIPPPRFVLLHCCNLIACTSAQCKDVKFVSGFVCPVAKNWQTCMLN